MPEQATDDLLYFNGVNGETGDYNLPPMTGKKLVQFIIRRGKTRESERAARSSQIQGREVFGGQGGS